VFAPSSPPRRTSRCVRVALAAGTAVTRLSVHWRAAGVWLALGCASTSDVAQDAAGSAGSAGATDGAAPICAAGSAGILGDSRAALSVVDRSLIGGPADYAADPELPLREATLVRSQRARREAAWRIAARVVAPIGLTGTLAPDGATLPTWQTWHHRDDLTRIFRRLYPGLGPEEQATRAALDPGLIDEAWEWNDRSVADFDEWTSERLEVYEAAIDDAAKLSGVGGVYRVGYAPGASRHVLESYAEILACRGSEELVESTPPILPEAGAADGCSAGPSFEPACLRRQFPSSAVLVKASWQRLDAGSPLVAYDTSAPSLAQKLSPGGGFAWGEGDRQAQPNDGEMYTLELPNGNRFGLTGLHIMTKELEHWVWVTLWWSDRPDEDFGADRPGDFPAAFARYKLCSVVGFEEGDDDPSGGFDGEDESLARALETVHSGAGGPTWCSNPYIERGAGNAATNCVGCHQHAGTPLRSEDILGAPEAFPDFSRVEQRLSFPTDYVFSVRLGDDLGAMFVETEEHYAAP
jgi:hypothetical protein